MWFRLLLLSWLAATTWGGETERVKFLNGSFEDEPADATVPHGWWGCAPYTTPDILPGYWGVYLTPSEGQTYVGLITRENGSFESIGQRLSGKLLKGICYSFLVDLAHSNVYAGYNDVIQLRIWLGNKRCGANQIIFHSPFIENKRWETFEVTFTPEQNYEYIVFEAYSGGKNLKKKGNILIDNLSVIINCSRA